MSFEGKSQQEIGKWTEYCLKKENGPRASSAPALELNTIIFKHVYWYMQQISGERLQDHWSSGLFFFSFLLLKSNFIFLAFFFNYQTGQPSVIKKSMIRLRSCL